MSSSLGSGNILGADLGMSLDQMIPGRFKVSIKNHCVW